MYCNNIVIPCPQLMFIQYTLIFVLYAHRLSSLLLINYYLLTYLLTYYIVENNGLALKGLAQAKIGDFILAS